MDFVQRKSLQLNFHAIPYKVFVDFGVRQKSNYNMSSNGDYLEFQIRNTLLTILFLTNCCCSLGIWRSTMQFYLETELWISCIHSIAKTVLHFEIKSSSEIGSAMYFMSYIFYLGHFQKTFNCNSCLNNYLKYDIYLDKHYSYII